MVKRKLLVRCTITTSRKVDGQIRRLMGPQKGTGLFCLKGRYPQLVLMANMGYRPRVPGAFTTYQRTVENTSIYLKFSQVLRWEISSQYF